MELTFPSAVPGDHALVLQAVRFASVAHAGQTRKYTGEPYLNHLLSVGFGVALRTMDPHIISAAVLHDVLEDTDTHPQQLSRMFSDRVAALVLELTDVYIPANFPELNRKERKKLEARRYGLVSAEAQLIKAYDLLDNTSTITAHDPGFAKVYLAEKRELLSHMDKLDPHERLLLAKYI
jgi:(p)ppGpp synthase/HD superfamily hydrolase